MYAGKQVKKPQSTKLQVVLIWEEEANHTYRRAD